MAASDSRKSAPSRLADRLAMARHGRFVGREAELALFRSALLVEEPDFALLYIYGPGGVGKTTLLNEYLRMATKVGRTVVLLDGRNIDVSPTGFQEAFQAALEMGGGAGMMADDLVLFVDTYELLAPLDNWLRGRYFPQLPPNVLIVLAGRQLPAAAWQVDPGWSDLTRVVSLRNLRPEESQTYLTVRGVPVESHAEVLAFTHGHPLALSLVADVLSQGDKLAGFNFKTEPDVVRMLLERFTRNVPDAQHRLALEICAHVRVMTEGLLAHFLGKEDAYSLFNWLIGLSFIQRNGQGLVPHDLARDVLDADFRWRDPQRYEETHHQVRQYYEQEIRKGAAHSVSADLLYLINYYAAVNPFFEWEILNRAYMEPATAADYDFILEKVREYEGEQSAEIAQYWLQKRPEAFIMFHTAEERQFGFVVVLMVAEIMEEDARADPVMEAARNFLRPYLPLRPGELLNFVRFWMGEDQYQGVEMQTLVALSSTHTWLNYPNMGWTFACTAEPRDWQEMFALFNFDFTGEVNFTVGGHQYGVFTHDWRKEPVADWLDWLGGQYFRYGLEEVPQTQPPQPPVLTLSQPEFAEAVRQALRDFTRPDLLNSNPLLRSRLVLETAENTPTPATLQALIEDAAGVLTANPKDEKFYSAVYRTYLKPAPSQETAAELLDLPLGTYRYRLAKGVERITEWLWRREIQGYWG